jgi:hypothetical protein
MGLKMPKITLTTYEMRNMLETLGKMAQMKLPIKASYWVGRLIAKLDGEYAASEKARNALVTELGEPVDGGGIQVTPENPNWKTFQERYTELMNVEIDIELPQIPLDQFGNIDIEPAALLALDKLIVSEETLKAA